MMKLFSLLVLIIFMHGCSSAIHIDINDLTPYSNELNAKEPFQQPYVSYFKKGEYTLTFVAAKHAEGDDNPTCKTIREEFKNNRYSFLLVEGMPFSKINEESEIEDARTCEKNNYKNCGEDSCAINEALKQNISFNYAEPSESVIKDYVISRGYTGEELMFFYGLRQIPQLKRQGLKTSDEIKNKLTSYLKRASIRRLKLNSVFTLNDFEKMFISKFKKNIDYLSIETDFVSPRVDDNPTWSNIMSNEVGVVREQFIIKMVEERVNTYKKVIIVYGSGHLVEARAALEKAFSSVESIKRH